MKAKKIPALLLGLAMITACAGCTVSIEVTDPEALAVLRTISVPAAAAKAAEPGGVHVSGGWYYTVSGGEATIVSADDAVRSADIILFPAELDGWPVTAVGADGAAVIADAGGWVLFPEGVRSIGDGAFRSLEDTPGWSFPSSLTEFPVTALDGCGGVFYAAVCPAAAVTGGFTDHEVDVTPMKTAEIGGAVYNVPGPLSDVRLEDYVLPSAEPAPPGSGEVSGEAASGETSGETASGEAS